MSTYNQKRLKRLVLDLRGPHGAHARNHHMNYRHFELQRIKRCPGRKDRRRKGDRHVILTKKGPKSSSSPLMNPKKEKYHVSERLVSQTTDTFSRIDASAIEENSSGYILDGNLLIARNGKLF